jgi:hypothetical protein
VTRRLAALSVVALMGLVGCGKSSHTTETTTSTRETTTTAAKSDAQNALAALPAVSDVGTPWRLVQEFVREPGDLDPNPCVTDRSLDALTGQASREFTRDLTNGSETAHLYVSVNTTAQADLQRRRRAFFETAQASACTQNALPATVRAAFPKAQVQKVTVAPQPLPAAPLAAQGFGRHFEAQFTQAGNVSTLAVDQYRLYAGRVQAFVEYQTCTCAHLPITEVASEKARVVEFVADHIVAFGR